MSKDQPNLIYKTIHAGQYKPYGDRVYVFEIENTNKISDENLWGECQKIKPCSIRDDAQSHSGCCGFPHGLDSFGSLIKIAENKYKYSVTYPYCD